MNPSIRYFAVLAVVGAASGPVLGDVGGVSDATGLDAPLSTALDMNFDQPADAPPTPPTPPGEGAGASEPAPRNTLFGPDHRKSWELPPVVVEGRPTTGLREEDRIGSYGQPRWTATRRFPSTRVYVIPEGKVEVEAWARATVKRSDQGGETDWRFLQELEIGLPYRFQLDFYVRQDHDTDSDDTLWGGQFEVRWALADWDVLPGNPTLYLEYVTLEDRPDKIEAKLLLGGEIAEGWHWGSNFVFEYELSGPEREAEYSLTGAVSRTIVDEVLSLGVEGIFSASDVKGERGDFDTSFVIGPSLQWRPVPSATINIAPLFGTTNESPIAQVYFNAGWEF